MDSKVSPKISLVTPSYNQGDFLEDTILSVLDQGYPNLEYIIIDGGSSDNSVEIIKKYEKYLHYWVSEQDDGQYHAINKGFSFATGDVFAWINSSDFYLPWTLKTVGSIFCELPEVSWLTTLNKLVFSEDSYCIRYNSLPAFSKEAFLKGCYLPIWPQGLGWIQQESTFWSKSLWNKVDGLNSDFSLAADFDLWGRFFDHAELFGVIAPLAGHRFHRDQLSRKNMDYKIDAEFALNNLRKKKGISPLNRKLKATSEDKGIVWSINLYGKIKRWPFLGGIVTSIYNLLLKLKKKKYHGKLINMKLDNNGDCWEIIEVEYDA